MSPIPTQMTSHWWQRPGRVPGREQYHWHMFHDQPKVHELVAAAQARIADQPGLDMIPIPWLHLTTYVVGFADEVADSAAEERSHARGGLRWAHRHQPSAAPHLYRL